VPTIPRQGTRALPWRKGRDRTGVGKDSRGAENSIWIEGEADSWSRGGGGVPLGGWSKTEGKSTEKISVVEKKGGLSS